MSPLEIEIMLHYYTTPGQYGRDRDGGHCPSDAPAVRDSLMELAKAGLLSYVKDGNGYQIADRGMAYVEFLKEVPLPIHKWVLP